MTPQQQVDHVIALERTLLRREHRGRADVLELLLDPEFTEIGASGRLWDRAEMMAAMLADPDTSVIRDEEMSGRVLADGLVLLVFVTDREGRRARRTSLWRRDIGGDWRMLHHQGTLAAPAPPPSDTWRPTRSPPHKPSPDT